MKKYLLCIFLFIFFLDSKQSFGQTNVLLVDEVNIGPDGTGINYPKIINNEVLFFATSPATGTELWKYNVTGGISLVKDINSGPDPSYLYPNDLGKSSVVMNNAMYFIAYTSQNGTELWKTDGTPNGTVIVKDINPGTGDGLYFHAEMVVKNGVLYFGAYNGTDRGLWKSDGTASGTQMLKNDLVLIEELTVEKGTLPSNLIYFSAYQNATVRTELWRTDGTASGTIAVVPSQHANTCCGLQPEDLEFMNGVVYFSAVGENSTGRELWKSDGSPSGTTMVKDIRSGQNVGSNPKNMTAVPNTSGGQTLFFIANNGASGRELWKSDGNAANTIMVKDINPGAGSSDIDSISHNNRKFMHHGGQLFFSANDGAHGQELWISDGNPLNTALKDDIKTGALGSFPSNLFNKNGSIYFSAEHADWGRELFETDAVSTGAILLEDIRTNVNGSYPGSFIDFNGTLLFSAEDDYNGTELRELGPNSNSTWRTINSGTIETLRSIRLGNNPSDPAFAVGGKGKILKSVNGGSTWTSTSSGVTENLMNAFSINNTTSFVVGANGTILKTTNGGQNWTPQTSGSTSLLRASQFTDLQNGWVVGAQGEILRTTNSGSTWAQQTSGVTSTLTSIAMINNTGYVVGFNGVILKTTNGGTNWVAQNSGTTENLFAVSFSSALEGYAVGNNGKILKTTDGGVNWLNIPSGTNNSLFSVSIANNNTVYVSGGSGLILKTVNSGNTWQSEANLTVQTIYSIQSINGKVVGCGGSGKILEALTSVNSVSNQNPKDNFISIYPNPANSFLNLEVKNNTVGQPFKIYNSLGKVLLSGTTTSTKMQIGIQFLPVGLYYLKFDANDLYPLKFIKN